MLPEAIELIVVTPERQLLRETVVEVTMPGLDGALGILPGHAPLITELGIGELSYRTATSSRPISLAVIRGFAEVLPDRVTLLAETAERAEEIDLARAEGLGLSAEAYLANNDAYRFFSKLDRLVVTGPTLTNVNDFRAIYIVGDLIAGDVS